MSNEAALFLASHLGELNHIEDAHEKMTVALASIAAVYPEINETILTMMVSQVTAEDAIKHAAISYFRGADIIDVHCDCLYDNDCDLNSYNKDFWWNRGAQDKQKNAATYAGTIKWIESLKKKLQ